MPGIHEHILDFEILETGNLRTIVFVDSSEYMEEPEKPLLEITPPGFTKYFLVNVDARKVNTFNANLIGITDNFGLEQLSDLPDGVWTFKYKVCPYNYAYNSKKVLRVTNLLKKVTTLYENIDLNNIDTQEDRNLETALIHIHMLIEGGKAVANKDAKKASDNYNLADRLVQKQLDKICKHCK